MYFPAVWMTLDGIFVYNLIAASPLFQLFCLLHSATQAQCRLSWLLKVMTFMEIQTAVFHRDLLLFCC